MTEACPDDFWPPEGTTPEQAGEQMQGREWQWREAGSGHGVLEEKQLDFLIRQMLIAGMCPGAGRRCEKYGEALITTPTPTVLHPDEISINSPAAVQNNVRNAI